MERAAWIFGEAHGNWFVAGHFLRALTQFKQSLVSILAYVWEDVVKGNLHSRQATDKTRIQRPKCSPLTHHPPANGIKNPMRFSGVRSPGLQRLIPTAWPQG